VLFNSGKPEEFYVKVAHTTEEACQPLKGWFEYATDMDGKKIFRKRK
jgi:hypothetical protein